MSRLAHRQNDSRTCGARTATGSSNVWIENERAARDDDTNSHGGGGINASTSTVFINERPAARVQDSAKPDNLCGWPNPPTHCNPDTTGSARSVYIGD